MRRSLTQRAPKALGSDDSVWLQSREDTVMVLVEEGVEEEGVEEEGVEEDGERVKQQRSCYSVAAHQA
ncbi:unnamed protein product [Arctogadus glacialis]